MSLPPESIQVGKCYLVRTKRTDRPHSVRRVVRIMPNTLIQYELRTSSGRLASWRPGMQDRRSFAAMVVREVSCDWTPEVAEEAL